MSQISAHVRLRPIRFAFVVRPDDAGRTLEIFRVNTCLGEANTTRSFHTSIKFQNGGTATVFASILQYRS